MINNDLTCSQNPLDYEDANCKIFSECPHMITNYRNVTDSVYSFNGHNWKMMTFRHQLIATHLDEDDIDQ